MDTLELRTPRLRLVLQSVEASLQGIANLPDEVRAELSPEWLALIENAKVATPWIHGFEVRLQATDEVIGSAGFKGPPTAGMVEIAYGIDEAHREQGYATEAAKALADYAAADSTVQIIRAHTLPAENASTRVLTKCGFKPLGEVTDPDDGLVWRWEIPAAELQTMMS